MADEYALKDKAYVPAIDKWSGRIEKYIRMVRAGLDSAEVIYPDATRELRTRLESTLAARTMQGLPNAVQKLNLGEHIIQTAILPESQLPSGDAENKKPNGLGIDFKNGKEWKLTIGEREIARDDSALITHKGNKATMVDLAGIRASLSSINPRTHLTMLEEIVVESLSGKGSYAFLAETNHPELFREFKSICENAATSHDKYVRHYMAAHDNKPLTPRVVILDSTHPQAMAYRLPFSEEPMIALTRGMIEQQSPLRTANILRRELGHAYRQCRNHDMPKRMAADIMTFNAARRHEERRADLFAPRNSTDLRELAGVFNDQGDNFEEINNRLRAVLGIILRHGVADEIINDLLSDGKASLTPLRAQARSMFANAFSRVLSEERQEKIREVPESSSFTRMVDRIGDKAKTMVTGTLEKATASKDIFDGGEISDAAVRRKTIKERSSPTHPPMQARMNYLEAEAKKMDGAPAQSHRSKIMNKQEEGGNTNRKR